MRPKEKYKVFIKKGLNFIHTIEAMKILGIEVEHVDLVLSDMIQKCNEEVLFHNTEFMSQFCKRLVYLKTVELPGTTKLSVIINNQKAFNQMYK